MKITVTIYNDDKAGNRDIQVVPVSGGKLGEPVVCLPGGTGSPPCNQFEIGVGDMLIVTATGS